jgi:hypothetical protein
MLSILADLRRPCSLSAVVVMDAPAGSKVVYAKACSDLLVVIDVVSLVFAII